MFITRKYIPRRTFLRGAGVTLALPFLESMIPAVGDAAAAKPTTRFAAVSSPHGWSPTYWADNREDGLQGVKIENPESRNVGLGFIHQPLEPFRDKLTIVSGLDATSSMPPPGLSGGDHSRAAAIFTGASPKKTAGGGDIRGPCCLRFSLSKTSWFASRLETRLIDHGGNNDQRYGRT